MLLDKIVIDAFEKNKIELITTVPCKQLSGVIDAWKHERQHDAYPSQQRRRRHGHYVQVRSWVVNGPAIIMQNTAIGVTINTLVTLTQFYRLPLPMLISFRGELGEPVACQVEMAVHTKALLDQLGIPTYHFHNPDDVHELDEILKYTFMCNKPVAILTDASFWKGE